MSESQCRWVGSAGNDDSGRASGRWGDPPRGTGRGGRRVRTGVLGVLVVLGWGLVQPGWSAGQEAPAAGEATPKSEPPRDQEAAEPLSLRYRFIEKYGLEVDPAKPELLTQYQGGVLETFKAEIEKPQGAP